MSGESVAILSHSEGFYSTRRLMEACRAQGLPVTRIDPIAVTLEPGGRPSGLRVGDRVLAVPDILIPRVGSRLTGWGMALVQDLVDRGATSAADAAAIGRAQDKLATTQRLSRAGIPTLRSVAVREPAHSVDALRAIGGAPVVIKEREGSQGERVHLAQDGASADALIQRLTASGATVLVQPFVASQPARDLRVLVVGGVATAACWRHAASGEFRSNVHRGGRVEAAELTPEVRELGESAARAMGLPLCGVDLLPDRGALVVLEVNASPGLKGIEAATGRDLAAEIVSWLRRARQIARGPRGT
jgi:ribosomal protein S6--L-glutamate ligase